MNTLLPSHDSSVPNASRFWREWLGNSLYFPILNTLLEALVSDPLYYLLSPNLVGLLLASSLQAWALSRWETMANPRRLLGNLIGPATFTAIGLSLQGAEFLSVPHHVAYWVFGLLCGVIQDVRLRTKWLCAVFVLGEAMLRGGMAAAMYYILRTRLDPSETVLIPAFLAEPGHLFVVLALLLVGLMAGLQNLKASHEQETQPNRRPRQGRNAQEQAGETHTTQTPKREERIVLAMDIRGLTRWSEVRQPEETFSLLSRYYQTAEATLHQHGLLKLKLCGGELLAFFSSVDDGLQAALKLRLQINALLHRQGLGVGMGLHVGPVLEGWLGGKDVKVMDVLGDSVEMTRIIEANAGLGELLVSEKMRMAIGATFRAGPKRFLSRRDRDEPVVVYPLE